MGQNIAGVQFRRAGKIYDFSYDPLDTKLQELRVGDPVVVDSERGASLATVAALKFDTHADATQGHKLKPVIRKLSSKELLKPQRIGEEEAFAFAKDKVEKRGLEMNILKSEIQFGGNKVVIYFSAKGRVDFRELVKDLAGGLKSRVELKQVGARDEAKLLGGLGICGREYCCSSFLRDFVPVSIKMAKNQNLALNPGKVSGGCGRLLCCLTYENEAYTALRKVVPSRGTKVKLLNQEGLDPHITGMVLKSDLLNQLVLVETDQGQSLSVKITDIEILDKTTVHSEDDLEANELGWGDDLDVAALEQYLDHKAPAPRPPRKHQEGKKLSYTPRTPQEPPKVSLPKGPGKPKPKTPH